MGRGRREYFYPDLGEGEGNHSDLLFILTLSPGGGGGLFATQFDDNNGDNNKITSGDCTVLNQTFDKLEFFSVLQFRAPMCVLAVFFAGPLHK